MRNIFWILLLLIYACGGGKYAGPDYTLNQSRAGSADREAQSMAKKDDPRSLIVGEAHKQLGKKYKYGKTGPHAFDCSGLTSYIYNKHGHPLPRRSVDQAKTGQRLDVDDIREGDLVIFTKGRKVSHVGICTERNKGELWVIHSTTSKGVIRENVLNSSYWRTRVRGGRQIIR